MKRVGDLVTVLAFVLVLGCLVVGVVRCHNAMLHPGPLVSD